MNVGTNQLFRRITETGKNFISTIIVCKFIDGIFLKYFFSHKYMRIQTINSNYL